MQNQIAFSERDNYILTVGWERETQFSLNLSIVHMLSWNIHLLPHECIKHTNLCKHSNSYVICNWRGTLWFIALPSQFHLYSIINTTKSDMIINGDSFKFWIHTSLFSCSCFCSEKNKCCHFLHNNLFLTYNILLLFNAWNTLYIL